MSRRIPDPMARSAAGAELRQLRIKAGVSVEELAEVYAGGVSAARILELENSARVHKNSATAYRWAIVGIVIVKRWDAKRAATLKLPENCELASDGR